MKSLFLFLSLLVFLTSNVIAADFVPKDVAGITPTGVVYIHNQKAVVDVGQVGAPPILHFADPLTIEHYDKEMVLNTSGEWDGYWTHDVNTKASGEVVISIQYGYTNKWFPQELQRAGGYTLHPHGSTASSQGGKVVNNGHSGSNLVVYPSKP